MRNFLWEYKEGGKTSHLVNWDLVRATKERGGLGVCNLRLMNLAMLAKWGWRYGVEKNKLWYKIIEEKYGADFSYWIPGKVTQTYGVSCWRVIADSAVLVSENSTLFLHSGSKIAFWNDIWCSQQSLGFIYPNLYKLSRDKDVRLADMISSEGNWRFDFKRVLTNSETEEFAALLTVIGDVPPIRDQLPDTRRWRLHSSGVFSVKTLYSKLVESHGIHNFPYLFVWKAAVPPKINLFVWSLVHGRLNTKDVLLRKGIERDNSCVLCGNASETQSHLFLHCNVAFRVWSQLLPTSRFAWVTPGSIMQLALCWHTTTFSHNGNLLWSLIPAAVFWSLWKERNSRTFDENHVFKTDDDLVNKVKTSILLWAAAAGSRLHVNLTSSVINDWDSLFM